MAGTRHAATGPRSVRIDAESRRGLGILRAITGIIVFFGLLLVYGPWGSDTEKLVTSGVPVIAKVDGKREYQGEDGMIYKIEYLYRFGGYPYTGIFSVDSDSYQNLTPGKPVQLTVYPGDPSIHTVGSIREQDLRDERTRHLMGIFAFAALVGTIEVFLRWYSRRNRNILATWPARSAQVVGIVERTDSENGTSYDISYRTQLTDGRVITRMYTDSESRGKHVRIGDFFTVLEPVTGLYSGEFLRPLHTLSMVEIDSKEPVAGTLSPK